MVSPLGVFFELIVGLIIRVADSIGFVAGKFFELFLAISSLAGGGVFGLVVATIAFSVIGIFVLRFIFHSAIFLITLVMLILFIILGLGFLSSL